MLAFNFLRLFPFPNLGACGQVLMYQIDFKNIQSLPTFLTEKYNRVFGAVTMNRTRDLLITSELLYQLSYDGLILFNFFTG